MANILSDPAVQRYIISGIFLVAGLLHFIKPGVYIKIMPDYVPYHETMVYLSGVAELAGAIGILLPEYRTWASWGLILLLIVVFPANIEMTLKAYKVKGLNWYTWLTILRLPLQFVLIYWIYKVGVQG